MPLMTESLALVKLLCFFVACEGSSLSRDTCGLEQDTIQGGVQRSIHKGLRTSPRRLKASLS